MNSMEENDVFHAGYHTVGVPCAFPSEESTEVGIHIQIEVDRVVLRLVDDSFINGLLEVPQDGLDRCSMGLFGVVAKPTDLGQGKLNVWVCIGGQVEQQPKDTTIVP